MDLAPPCSHGKKLRQDVLAGVDDALSWVDLGRLTELARATFNRVRILVMAVTGRATVLVIVMGVIDVAWTLYQKLISPPGYILTISDILATFGAFMAVLIAIEIFINITVYLREDVIHVKIVMATALMAIARKVIIRDLEQIEPEYLWGIASVVIAVSIGYWLVVKLPRFDLELGPGKREQKRSTARQDDNAPSSTARTDVVKPE